MILLDHGLNLICSLLLCFVLVIFPVVLSHELGVLVQARQVALRIEYSLDCLFMVASTLLELQESLICSFLVCLNLLHVELSLCATGQDFLFIVGWVSSGDALYW